MRKLLIGFCLVFGSATALGTELSDRTGYLLGFCAETEKTFCLAIVTSYYRGLTDAHEYLRMSGQNVIEAPLFCPDEDHPPSSDELVKTFVDYAKANLKDWNKGPEVLMGMSFRKAWPCD